MNIVLKLSSKNRIHSRSSGSKDFNRCSILFPSLCCFELLCSWISFWTSSPVIFPAPLAIGAAPGIAETPPATPTPTTLLRYLANLLFLALALSVETNMARQACWQNSTTAQTKNSEQTLARVSSAVGDSSTIFALRQLIKG